jgi:hypothetical protein
MQRLELRNPLHLVTTFLVMLVLSMLTACAGMQKPVTAQDYVQSAKGQVTAAYKSIGDLKAQGSITSAQGLGYVDKVDSISRKVSAVQKLADDGADLTTVQGALKTTLAGLVLLQAELNSKGK